jgi:hypothetical protein
MFDTAAVARAVSARFAGNATLLQYHAPNLKGTPCVIVGEELRLIVTATASTWPSSRERTSRACSR